VFAALLIHLIYSLIAYSLCVFSFENPQMDFTKRLSFANGYHNMDWTRVVFSDEACFWTGDKGRVWVRRPRGTDVAFDEKYVCKKEHKGDKVNVLGFFTSAGVGELICFDENMTAVLQKKLMKQGLLPTVAKFFPSGMW
jgi:hypothetical protein